ncbi:MAG: NAD-dependent succinate-semialdehyde dehydrogenase [Cyclobacteriaceae bacterium]|nr:NAD-dependent succinate-semialdehyde dehydrogenase [Cyclobacteriaceae bacterium HetDA_MAG_MS6]
MIFQSINPNDLSIVAEYPAMSEKKVLEVIEKSQKAYKTWRTTSFNYRADLLRNVSQVLRDNKENFAQLITAEMGKILQESLGEVEKSASNCDYYALNAEEFLQTESIKADDLASASIVFDPLGCVFAIMPWNFPFWQVFRYAAKVLMAGNVTILKHSPNVCGCALTIESIFREAGVPDGVFQTVIIDIPQVEKIIAADIVQGVSFTGSEKAGAQVAALAGKHIKKSVMELGGSDAFLVLEDADSERAAQVATQSRMLNAGQACNVAKRFIVVKSVADDFIDAFARRIENLKQGDPRQAATDIGPMAGLRFANELIQQRDESLAQGARDILLGSREDCHVSPSLLVNVNPGMPVFDEEVFGPVASVVQVSDEKEAIRMSNEHRYGLDASIWTKDLDRAAHIARQLDVGGVFVNTMVRSDSRFPFGGVKKSGYGRELSTYGLKEFMNVKALIMDA